MTLFRIGGGAGCGEGTGRREPAIAGVVTGRVIPLVISRGLFLGRTGGVNPQFAIVQVGWLTGPYWQNCAIIQPPFALNSFGFGQNRVLIGNRKWGRSIRPGIPVEPYYRPRKGCFWGLPDLLYRSPSMHTYHCCLVFAYYQCLHFGACNPRLTALPCIKNSRFSYLSRIAFLPQILH
jgi:hypothetical protein